jgi:hypothetical protein
MTAPSPTKNLADALAELASVRDEARVQMHLFSLEAKQRWNEIEAKIEAASGKGSVGESALSALFELSRAAREFIEEHRRP